MNLNQKMDEFSSLKTRFSNFPLDLLHLEFFEFLHHAGKIIVLAPTFNIRTIPTNLTSQPIWTLGAKSSFDTTHIAWHSLLSYLSLRCAFCFLILTISKLL